MPLREGETFSLLKSKKWDQDRCRSVNRQEVIQTHPLVETLRHAIHRKSPANQRRLLDDPAIEKQKFGLHSNKRRRKES